MAKLTASQIYTLLLEGGFSESQARTMTAIAQAESARDTQAVGDVALQDGKWGPSVGLFQIRTLRAETGTGGDRDIERLLADPRQQVKAAFEISNGGTNFKPWSTFNHGSHRKFLDEPLQAGVPVPAFAGGGGGGTTALATGGDPFAIDSGAKPSAIFDTDSDGLTDDFEKLFGTDPKSADSDSDGLSDAFETSRSHTDPLLADTDSDGITDSVEVAAKTDAGRAEIPDAVREAGFGGLDTLDSDSDGLSDGFERRIGSDPEKADTDSDGLTDAVEVARGLSATSVDTDRDGLTDGVDTDTAPLTGAPGTGVPGAGGVPGSDGGVPGGSPGYDDLPSTSPPGDDPGGLDTP
jgi:hypothetical protein